MRNQLYREVRLAFRKIWRALFSCSQDYSAFCLFTDELILSSEGLTFRILLVFNKTKENSQESYESIIWFKQIPGGVPFLF